MSSVLLTGLKFPTGDSSRIKEEFHEVELPGPPSPGFGAINAPESGIHGHDLTLGTGSYDGVFGEQNSLRYRNLFFETNVQFTLRGDGAHQYHFANDLTWSAGPGYYFVRDRGTVAGLQFVVSGEHKDVDRFRGMKAEDTGIDSVFVGPRIVASRGTLERGGRCRSSGVDRQHRVASGARLPSARRNFRAVRRSEIADR